MMDILKLWKETSRLEAIILVASLCYFTFKAIYFATTIGVNVFPDETTWFGMCEVFSHSFLPPQDSPDSYQFGPITRLPILYFFLMGKLLHLNIFPVSDLVFLRFMNGIMGVMTIWYGWKAMRFLTTNLPARLLFIIFMSNTLMLTFLFASVSYDNLTNLLAAIVLYHLSAFLVGRKKNDLLFTFVFLGLGGLTKITFLPFAFLVVLALIMHEWQQLPSLPAAVKETFSRPFSLSTVLSLLLFIMVAANAELYAGNLIRFQTLEPNAGQILPLENALQYRIYARGYILGQYAQKKIRYYQAVQLTDIIKNESDRQGTLFLLKKMFDERGDTNPPRKSRFKYVEAWVQLMLSKIYGIMGHQSMEKTQGELIPYFLILGGGLLLMAAIMPFTPLQASGWHLLFIFAGYAVILMQVVNYKTYHASGILTFALQGRYLFPVIVPLHALAATYLMAGLRKKFLQWPVAAAAAAVFLYGEFPWFLGRVTHTWFF